MNNNNIYFSCFSLIRACVSSLFANFYKVVCVCLVVCFALCSPLAAFASTTESMMMFSIQQDDYSVMPTAIYDKEDVSISFRYSIMDRNLGTYLAQSTTSTRVFPANERFNGNGNENYIAYLNSDITNLPNANTVQITMSITDASGASDPMLALQVLGYQLELYAPSFDFRYYDGNSIVSSYRLTANKPVKAFVRNYGKNGELLDRIDLNLNDIKLLKRGNGNFLDSNIITVSNPASISDKNIYSIDVVLQYELPAFPDNFTRTFIRCEFPQSNSYISGVYNVTDSTGSTSQDDYNKNVEAELGNIQTGINNVINSVVQMGNQAWQGAQQTVQAVTQMTQQLNTAIDQQRQDILNGLGLLGDDIGSSLTNVKTEITNIGSSITSKIESTTETITNTIENKVDEVTTAVEDVKQSVTEVKQSILDLPNKIKDMLLGLIVPDAETMGGKYSEFTELLEVKLGVIYQIPAMILELFETLVSGVTDPQTTLTFPSLSLPWIDGTQMKLWDSIEFEIIPTGMDVLKELIQTVTSMVCVIMTFNSVKRIYENFLRGR